MKDLIILGGSGIGMIAASIANQLPEYNVSGFLNDVVSLGQHIGKFKSYPVLGVTEDLPKFLDSGCHVFIAYVGLGREKETFDKIESLKIPDNQLARLIDPTAVLPEGMCSLGKGILVGPLAQLSPDTTMEDHSIVLGSAFLGHDSTLRKFAHIASNSVVGANVDVGRGVHIGTNSTIREGVKIADFSLIGSGAVVLNDVGENEVVVGNPARVLRQR